ncbi:hypothetical protein [Oceanicaulis sp. UBA2681]|jgi:hypothetical protein|uniref:hypothetical protein n=1 Tax=unclassified Oceanicaulis TaxID=2632123 RepID=UPI000ECD369E|nr:hypothetical protein [Oceanicaulis sp. UBA2681]MBL4538398.1 hypothetical protein [Oceanicaulis sp.]HCR65945.1 hypothetical protein [Oceanicaulis sp.]|tara:strand:- start:51 stop:245 length:195 start_codon:yes stop_codon:yes gene_type:complete
MMIIQVRERGGCFGGGCLGVVALAGWITAVVRDAMMVKWLWLIFDLALAPLGAIRGFMMWFGWA